MRFGEPGAICRHNAGLSGTIAENGLSLQPAAAPPGKGGQRQSCIWTDCTRSSSLLPSRAVQCRPLGALTILVHGTLELTAFSAFGLLHNRGCKPVTSNKDLDPIRADEPIKHAGTEANKEASPPLIPIPPTSTQERNLHPLPNRCEITCKTEKNWWDQTKPYVELAGIVFLFVYSLYKINMYSPHNKSSPAPKTPSDPATQSLIYS